MSESAVLKVEEKKQSLLGTAKNTDEIPLENAVKLLMQSGMVKDGEKVGNLIARLSLGRSLGLPDLQSVGGIIITDKGQVMMSAVLMNSLIRRSGKYYLVGKQRDVKGASIEAFQKIDGIGWVSCGVPITFGPEDAKRAKLDTKETYLRYPSDMYWNRAIASLFRAYCSDCCSAPAYLPEELDGHGYRTDMETGELVAEAEYVEKSKTRSVPISVTPASKENTLEDLKQLVKDTNSDLSALMKTLNTKTEADLTQGGIDMLCNTLRAKQRATPK